MEPTPPSFAIRLFLGSLFILFLYNILFAIRGCSPRHYIVFWIMRININKTTYVIAFVIGVIVHLMFWYYTINFDSTPSDNKCGETSCWQLVFLEFPASLLYVSGDSGLVTKGSLFVGSIWWGFILVILLKVYSKLRG